MEKLVKSSLIDLNVTATASKSMAQRAVIASMLAKGKSTLTGITRCEDTDAAIDIAILMGAKITMDYKSHVCEIESSFDKDKSYIPNNINCGESGLLSRIMIPLMALNDKKITVTGRGSLLNRPFDTIKRPLKELGAEISLTDNHLPATIKWGMKGGETSIDGTISSQFITGLLIALPLAERNSELYVVDLKSKPYVDMTIDMLLAYGIEIENDKYISFRIKGKQEYKPATINIDGDWSNSAILLVAGALAGEISISNLNVNSPQGDRVILDLFKLCNVDYSIINNSVTTRKSKVKAFGFDISDFPDLLPPIVILATQADDVCCIKGVGRMQHKESSRAEILKSELFKVGINIELDEDLMYIYPGEIVGGEVDAHNDHRLAMVFAVAGLCSKEGILIHGAESVAKSYPDFWKDMNLE